MKLTKTLSILGLTIMTSALLFLGMNVSSVKADAFLSKPTINYHIKAKTKYYKNIWQDVINVLSQSTNYKFIPSKSDDNKQYLILTTTTTEKGQPYITEFLHSYNPHISSPIYVVTVRIARDAIPAGTTINEKENLFLRAIISALYCNKQYNLMYPYYDDSILSTIPYAMNNTPSLPKVDINLLNSQIKSK
ncbi:hypothetical protein [Apilactobacillus xinyiensis]|uniref:hypothetical protein n=1 Tax=Apilactobacillus xinyiensis TaxID=2841032 RepID=UPI001C7DDFC6|nr:hypothetical protein [Apilactobacillus xinyiensis]